MKNKKSKREQLMNFLNGTMYIGLAYAIIYGYRHYVLFNSSFKIVDKIVFAVIGLVFCIWLFLCQQESLEDHAQTTKEVFSINISLVALVVSVIALLRGV